MQKIHYQNYKQMKKIIFTVFTILITFTMQAQQTITLYPNGAPNSNGLEGKEHNRDKEFIVDIATPRMDAFVVPKEKSNGYSVIICPGGGYSGVSHIKEGEDMARWFNNLGISAFVLYYRMPNGHYNIPLQDAQKAIEIVQQNAKAWHLKTNKIGIMGFSAGGHLASTVGTHWAKKKHRPAFMILGYPVVTMHKERTHMGSRNNLLGKNASDELVQQFSNELRVNRKTPPTFIFHSRDDGAVPYANATDLKAALDANKVKATLALYEQGGHGYGMRNKTADCKQWPEALKAWLIETKILSE